MTDHNEATVEAAKVAAYWGICEGCGCKRRECDDWIEVGRGKCCPDCNHVALAAIPEPATVGGVKHSGLVRALGELTHTNNYGMAEFTDGGTLDDHADALLAALATDADGGNRG